MPIIPHAVEPVVPGSPWRTHETFSYANFQNGPSFQGASIYVVARRYNIDTGTAYAAVYKSSDGITFTGPLDFANAPIVAGGFGGPSTAIAVGNTFYIVYMDGDDGLLKLIPFAMGADTYGAISASTIPVGGTVTRSAICVVKLSTGALRISWAMGSGSEVAKSVLWNSGAWGTPITIVPSPSVTTVELYFSFVASNDVTFFFYRRNDTNILAWNSVDASNSVGVESAIESYGATLTQGSPGFGAYFSDSDTGAWVWVDEIVPIGPGHKTSVLKLIKISSASSSPSASVQTLYSLGPGRELLGNPSIWRSTAGLYEIGVLYVNADGSDEQIWRFESSDLSTWPASPTIDWDYLTNPPPDEPFIDQGTSPFAPVATGSTYATLLSFLNDICGAQYYFGPAPPQPTVSARRFPEYVRARAWR